MGAHLRHFTDRSVGFSTSVVLLSLSTATRRQFIDQCLGFVLVQSRSTTVFEREMLAWFTSCSISNEINISMCMPKEEPAEAHN